MRLGHRRGIAALIAGTAVVLLAVQPRLTADEDDKSRKLRGEPPRNEHMDPAAPEQDLVRPAGIPPRIPARTVGSEARCPPGEYGFDNPALHYRICLPEDWGVWDLESRMPPAMLDSLSLYHMRFAGSASFPRQDESVLDSVARTGRPIVTVFAGDRLPVDACTPTESRSLANVAVDWCTYAFDRTQDTVTRADNGKFLSLLVRAPLMSEPVPSNPSSEAGSDSFLLVMATMSSASSERRLAEAWRILGGLSLY